MTTKETLMTTTTTTTTTHTPDAALDITVEPLDADHAIVTLGGRFDAVEALEVRRRLTDELSDVDHLVIDLTEVRFIDSAGLAALARARRDRVLRGGSVTLVRPRNDDAMRVFRLTQFDAIFTMVDERGTDPAP